MNEIVRAGTVPISQLTGPAHPLYFFWDYPLTE